MTWRTVYRFGMAHVIPVDDIKAHEDSVKCWCRPEVEEDGALIIHYAMDRRENYETPQ